MCGKSIFGGHTLNFIFKMSSTNIKNVIAIVILVIVCILVGVGAVHYGTEAGKISAIRTATQNAQYEQIKNADCATLGDIYIDENNEYIKKVEEMAKKRFDVKCVANPLLGTIP